jgi:hypothetical protein
MATKTPWAILLCKFKNSPPGTTHIDPAFDFISLCKRFFTNPNANFNAVKFFTDMSHQKIDISSSQVSGWYVLNASITGFNAAGDPILDATQDAIVSMAKQAAQDAGVPITTFTGAVVIMDIATGWAQGGSYSGLKPIGCMASDWRRVDGRNADSTKGAAGIGGGNGTEIFGQEMGHGFGLDHSRKDGSTDDYQDAWDIMSTAAITHAAPDNEYGARGPGMNAWNMRGRGWLDETRVWHSPNGAFDQKIQLRPLHRHDLQGFLAAELPPMNETDGFPKYLVEFRKKEGWDSGIPRSCILVHRFEVSGGGSLKGFINSRSYIMPGTNGNYDLVDGEEFNPGTGSGPFPKLKVIKIDEANSTADIQLSYANKLPNFRKVITGTNADNRLEAFALGFDGSVFHKWQLVPNGGWSQWAGFGGHDLQQIVATRNQDGRLELFALGGDKKVYHIWQTIANGGWGKWASLNGHDLQQITVARNKDGRLELFALGGDKSVYHIWQTVANGNWGNWASLQGHDLRQITAAQNKDGRLELFALGGDRSVYHTWQTVANGNWGNWTSLQGHDLRQIEPGINNDGRLELFAIGGDKSLYHIWQTAPNGGWGKWASLQGHDLQQVTTSLNQDGRMELFALGGDNSVYDISQTVANGNWGKWTSLQGHDLQQITAASNADKRIELFAVGGNGTIYHRWQNTPNGAWKPWFAL